VNDTAHRSAEPRFWRDATLPFIEARAVADGRKVCYAPHCHETFSIGAITAGRSTYFNGEARERLERGAVVIVNPQTVHACNPIDGQPWSYLMFYVDAGWLGALQHELGASADGRFSPYAPILSRDPALFTEDMGPKVMPRTGWAKDSVEVEGYVRGFSRRRSDVDVAVLRLANFIGPHVATALTDYFELPVVPTVLGFDPRFQVVHEDDGLEALRLATLGDVTGFLNVAGDGFVTVHQAVRMAGRPALPVPGPLMPALGSAVRSAGLVDFTPDHVRFLSYGRGLDTTRMRADLGLEPRWTSLAFRSARNPFDS
jgi:hypothetical protein